jgi:hypothetical protein
MVPTAFSETLYFTNDVVGSETMISDVSVAMSRPVAPANRPVPPVTVTTSQKRLM